MKQTIILAILLALFFSCNEIKSDTTNKTRSNDTMANQDKQQIEQLLSVYKKSLNTSDAALANSLYATDGIFMPSGAPSAVGSENILKSYQYIFSQIQLNIEFQIDEIIVESDVAYATTSSKGTTLIHANQQTVPEENRELFVFRKVDGEWKIARYMFNKTS